MFLLVVFYPVSWNRMSNIMGQTDVVARCWGEFLVSAASLTRSRSKMCMIFEEHSCDVISASLAFGVKRPLTGKWCMDRLFRAPSSAPENGGTYASPALRGIEYSGPPLTYYPICIRGRAGASTAWCNFSASARRRLPCFHPFLQCI